MTPALVVTILTLYFGVLILIAVITSKGANTDTFFTGNRQSPWYLVAFGMIGASLSGVTFISVPGNVGKIGFGYFQYARLGDDGLVPLRFYCRYFIFLGDALDFKV